MIYKYYSLTSISNHKTRVPISKVKYYIGCKPILLSSISIIYYIYSNRTHYIWWYCTLLIHQNVIYNSDLCCYFSRVPVTPMVTNHLCSHRRENLPPFHIILVCNLKKKQSIQQANLFYTKLNPYIFFWLKEIVLLRSCNEWQYIKITSIFLMCAPLDIRNVNSVLQIQKTFEDVSIITLQFWGGKEQHPIYSNF